MWEESEEDQEALFLYMILTLQDEDDTADWIPTVNLTCIERKF